jgi:hypothetical protein
MNNSHLYNFLFFGDVNFFVFNTDAAAQLENVSFGQWLFDGFEKNNYIEGDFNILGCFRRIDNGFDYTRKVSIYND